jgi:hypothetical protein
MNHINHTASLFCSYICVISIQTYHAICAQFSVQSFFACAHIHIPPCRIHATHSIPIIYLRNVQSSPQWMISLRNTSMWSAPLLSALKNGRKNYPTSTSQHRASLITWRDTILNSGKPFSICCHHLLHILNISQLIQRLLKLHHHRQHHHHNLAQSVNGDW